MNPDFLEIVEGFASTFAGNLAAIASNTINKLSGYHREFQIGKKLTIDSIMKIEEIIVALSDMFSKISFDKERAGKAIQNSSYATNYAAEMVKSGNAWRDSYREAGKRIADNDKIPVSNVKSFLSIDKKRLDALKFLIEENLRKVNESKENLLREAKECAAQIQETH
jgi:argininosuccinate lyase